MPSDIAQAIALATAIARTNPRAQRDLIHIKVSPSKPLSDDGVRRVLDMIETEHAIPSNMPRLVVSHKKGSRAEHFHIVYPLVVPATGRAVRSHGNYLKDEIAARLAEIALDEIVVPGSYQRGVIAELDRRGLTEEVAKLVAHPMVLPGDRLGHDTRQHAAGNEEDADQMAGAAFAIWQDCGGDAVAFDKACREHGYSIAQGDRAILLMHQASGAHIPLARALRQRAKKAGQPLDIRERELQASFVATPKLADARDAALEGEAERAQVAVASELMRLEQEAMRDGQRQLADRLRVIRERERHALKTLLKRTLAARRADIRADYSRRDRIRRARVNRAFLIARIVDHPELRRMVFTMAAASIVLAGGGLGVALIAAGIAVAALPNRERARSVAFEARLQRADDNDTAAQACREAYAQVAAESRNQGTRLDFAAIPKRHRAAAGAFCRLLLDKADGRHSDTDEALARALRRLLGDQAQILEAAILRGPGQGALVVMSWYDKRQARHRGAVAAALRQAGETEVASRLYPVHTKVRRDQGPGR